ncbi:hypothetical protein [Aeromonas caviae]|uniref:Uncharacterized protein n=1 Tax=Aeromonas caviae TaxID=648 RepID=A0AAW9F842_AERCA|nr:hypothetical protein [Aeromonas caviae]MCY9809032.1 hypothetical protein [Aeromonas caviae]MDX7707835.1 hypothetical protein [Aeromonas caviae]MDX7721916.1 hypothetical protein [Aeromonas caviae]MDX7805850.1 hypothetical protein [Aeromonas caviae]GJA04996.1 hypothetical protein KAM333_04240 [Aeromonas caviae]
MFENLAVLFHLKGATSKKGAEEEKDTYAPATRNYYFRYGA